MSKEKKNEAHTEGREEFFMDVDRMINEGLGGGMVSDDQTGIIEEARKLEKEDPIKPTSVKVQF